MQIPGRNPIVIGRLGRNKSAPTVTIHGHYDVMVRLTLHIAAEFPRNYLSVFLICSLQTPLTGIRRRSSWLERMGSSTVAGARNIQVRGLLVSRVSCLRVSQVK